MFKTPLLPLAALFAIVAATPVRSETNFGQVAMYVANMLQNHHLSHREFDEQMSKKVLDGFLNFLDFSHSYFTQQDVDGFRAKYATTLPDYVSKRNVSPAIEIYDIYEARVKERVEFVKKLLAAPKFTFDSKRTVEVKRDKLPWPKDKAAQDKLWSDIIEGSLLDEKLSDRAKAETALRNKEKKDKKDQAKADAAPDAAAPADAKVSEAKTAEKPLDDPPEKRVMKRYERLIEQLSENGQEEIVNFFLASLSTSYDPHTEYMSQSEMDNFNISMKHSLVGVGALLQQKDNVAEIQGIVVGGPADKQSDLKPGDKIYAVAQGAKGDWVDIKYMKLQKIVEMIRGKSGTVVRLKVHPGDSSDTAQVKEIAITRAEVELKDKVANADLLITPGIDGKRAKVGWINLSSFYADMEEGTVSTTTDVSRLLKRLIAERIDGLVFDLRGNGGGSLEEAIKLTGLFVPKGPVVQAKDWRDNISWRECENERPLYDGPMVVLTDRTSASASEIFAAALQDYRRAVIVGDKSTFGKGTVQTILPVERYMPFFSDKSRAGALKVTIQKFYRIAGGSTQLRGVIPDLQLPSLRNVMDIGEDALPNALPYDTIPSRNFTLWSKNPLPFEELNSRLKARIATNPEFQYTLEDAKRLQDRIDKNAVSLNDKERQQEIDEARGRDDKRKEERKHRVKEIAEKDKEGIETFHLTLDNVDQHELVKGSAFTKEQATGMRMGKKQEPANDDEDAANDGTQFAYGIEPAKLETLSILRDWIELSHHTPTTAHADEPAKKRTAP